MATFNKLSVSAIINQNIDKVWQHWNEPQHITKWYQASDDWHAPYAENNLSIGGQFKTTMAAKDGSFSFDFAGEYTEVTPLESIAYILADDRTAQIKFENLGNTVKITEVFDAETENSLELQQGGWQAILDSFKKYSESL
jgi:uncharacterized protein YndB with AHSA1/START domain